MKLFTQFDVVAAKIIGKLPETWHRPFSFLAHLTTPWAWMGIIVFLIMFGFLPDNQRNILTVILLITPLATILKLFIRRTRPPTIYADAMRIKSYSFPSSHAYAAALVGGYFAATAIGSDLWLLGIVFVFLTVVIGISRIHLGAHYPSDVLSGWLLGISVLYIIFTAA